MGKTQGSTACQTLFTRGGGFSRLRPVLKPPSGRRTIEFSLGVPEEGVVDLSEYQEEGVIPAELIPAITPISAVHENADQAEAYRAHVLAEFKNHANRSFAFLPEEYQGGTDEHISISGSPPYGAKIVERFWADDNIDPVANSVINRPLEIIAIERYNKAAAAPSAWSQERGVGHYVFDPLSERWFLVDRWGRGNKKKRTNTITPYLQSAAAGRRMEECQAALEQQPLQRPEEFPQASVEQIEERMKAVRQQYSR